MGASFTISNDSDKPRVIEHINKLNVDPVSIVVKFENKNPNSWPMMKTWRMWMSETAKFMSASGVYMPQYFTKEGVAVGRRPFDANDAHELFVRRWLGVDAEGERYRTASGDKGKMLYMMNKHVEWAVDKAIFLTIPEDSEFQKLNEAQES